MSDGQKIALCEGLAGGWGAPKSAGKTWLAQGIAAKGARTMLHANQPDGFDCPGRA